jgi:hypothetical protein
LFQDFRTISAGRGKEVSEKGSYVVQVSKTPPQGAVLKDNALVGIVETKGSDDYTKIGEHGKHKAGDRCKCCSYADWLVPGFEQNRTRVQPPAPKTDEIKEVFAGKKYKPVALKVRPVFQDQPEEFRIERNIVGDPLEGMRPLEYFPPDFKPVGRYTQERKEMVDEMHNDDFLLPEEMKLVHHMLMIHEDAVAWNDSERGTFKEEFFPPVRMPVKPDHKVWVERNIPIPPGQLEEVCKVLRASIDANIYEPSNSAY